MRFRDYGPAGGHPIVVMHGGPGAVGSCGSLAALLADPWHVFEPWQRAATLAEHIADVDAFIAAHCDRPPVIVGHSWGAMLALAFAAAHPARGAALCLIGCGTFDEQARAVFRAAEAKLLPADFDALSRDQQGMLIDRAYVLDPLPDDPLDRVDTAPIANDRSWSDMLRRQADGTYPATFARIAVPVLMVHGADDPHPGEMIRASLARYLPQLDYRELAHCSHYPWRERGVRDDFTGIVRAYVADVAT